MTGTNQLLDANQTTLDLERFFEETNQSEEARSFLTGSWATLVVIDLARQNASGGRNGGDECAVWGASTDG